MYTEIKEESRGMEDDRKMSLYKAPDYIQNGAHLRRLQMKTTDARRRLQMKKLTDAHLRRLQMKTTDSHSRKLQMKITDARRRLQMKITDAHPETPDEVAAKMKAVKSSREVKKKTQETRRQGSQQKKHRRRRRGEGEKLTGHHKDTQPAKRPAP